MKKANFTKIAGTGLRGLMLVLMTFVMGNAYGQAQCAMVCNNLVQISMDQDCIVPITFSMILESDGAGCPGGNFQVTVYKDATGAGGVLPTSPNVTVAVLNKTLLVKVKDLISGNSCWGHVLIEDKLDPVCVIQDVFATCANTASYSPSALQNMGFAGAFPTVSDNCGSVTTSNVTWFTDLGCDDVVGNLAVRNEVPAVVVKSDATGFVIGDYDESTNKLTLTITYSGLTGGLVASHIHRGAFGVAGGVVTNTGLPNGATFGSGTFTYTLSAADELLLLANGLYVNLHTTANPAGEIRAQIWTDQSAVAKRTWTVTDGSGNHVTCDQYIYFDRYHTVDLLNPATGGFPADITIDCANADVTPGNTGTPYVVLPNGSFFGLGSNHGCELNIAYTDQYFDICDGSYKILRTWVVYDWCAPLNSPLNPTTNPIYYIQLIKVLDTHGPTIYNCPADYTVSVDAWACSKQLDLPTLSVDDDCSSIANAWAIYTNPDNWISQTISASISPDPLWTGKFLVNFGTIANAPVGIHSVTMYVEDDCGNVSTCQVDITVADLIPPVTICHEFTQIGIGSGYVDNFTCPGETGPNGSAPDVPGIAEVPASSFDNGSYDKCGPVWLKVRRMDGGSCGGTTFNDFTTFCCSDIGGTWTVILRAYDVNPGTGSISQDALDGHYNDCMVTVYVEDKIKPICQAPAPVTTTCEQFDPLIWYGALTFSDNCGIKNIDTSLTYVPNQITFEQCNYGQVRRTFTVNDCSNNSSRCTQTITVHYKEQYRVYFPDDLNITVCNGPNTLVNPIIFGENCELIGISHEDELFDVVPDACYKILRHWSVLNWCTYNPNLNPVNIPNSATSTQGARIWIGAGNAAGTIPGWANYNSGSPEVSTVPALMINYPASLVNPGTPEYRYVQVIKVQDQTPPTQLAIDPSLSTPNYNFCDYSPNHPDLWNEDASYNPWGVNNTWSPLCNSHDLCEGPVDLSIRGTDACTGNNVNFRYLLFLDLNGDGVMETTINSEIPTLGFGIREDEVDGDFRIGRVTRDFESDDPDHTKYSNFELPYGAHKIKWIIEDRCGNDFTKEYPIIVRDCKNPTVVCINGLSINQMNTPIGVMPPSVCLWATDFLQYAEDNCSLPFQIDFAIRDADINPGSGFPANASELCWDCSQLGTNTVELWAKDKHGNADYCLTYLILSDNTGACGPVQGQGSIAGALKTPAVFGVAEATVELKQMQPNAAFPDLSYFPNTPDNGQFNFAGVPMIGDYKVTPAKDANYLNGVSTFDLVEMSKHILGVKKFTKGEQYLAADINNNKQVTTFDIVELRKLILGVYQELPSNTSWRFVDKTHVFDMAAPLAGTLPESKIVPTNSLAADFTGVKIGDINGDAIANNLMQVDDRTNGTFLLNVEDKAVKAGEEFTVNFKVTEKVLGAQFTLNYGGLEIVEIVGGNGFSKDNFAVFASESAITTSFDGNASEFAVKFRATTDGKISQFIGLSNRITNAEAYSLDEQKMEVAISFREGQTTTIAGVAFELYQNEPNPVKGETTIRFNLPEAAAATLTITDVQGRTLKIINTDGAKGLNTVVINRAELNASGVVFYQLDSAAKSASKKMVIVD